MVHDVDEHKARRLGPAANAGPVASYHTAAFETVLLLFAKAASEDAATAFRALVRWRGRAGGAALDLAVVDGLCGFGADGTAIERRLRAIDQTIATGFGFTLLAPRPAAFAGPTGAYDAEGVGGSEPVRLSSAFEALLAPGETTAVGAAAARLDAQATAWATVVAGAAKSGAGHHLVLRSATPGARAISDFAAHVGSSGVPVVHLIGSQDPRMEILHAELHAGSQPAVIIVDGEALVLAPPPEGELEDWSEGPVARDTPLVLTRQAANALAWLVEARNTYVWRVPAEGALPDALVSVIAGCIGPMGFDVAWSAAVVDGAVPGLGTAGARVLLSPGGDPRETLARARVARIAAAALNMPPIEACRMIATSFAPLDVAPVPAPTYDPRLFVCDPDGLALLERAPHLARGARVLVFGPPGGGKSTYALALASRLGSATGIVVVEPARFLAKGWGATERLLAAMWQQARCEGAALVVDEFDSMCGVREAGTPTSGNAYLIRTLTNEWLRRLDAEPDVPVIATVNDLEAIDPTARRRFQIVIEVKAALDAERERLAWNLIFGLDCPPDWAPTGAAIADFASAVARCQMLGRVDPTSHVEALASARRTREGARGSAPGGPRRRPLH